MCIPYYFFTQLKILPRGIMQPSDIFSELVLLGLFSYGNLSRNWLTAVTFSKSCM